MPEAVVQQPGSFVSYQKGGVVKLLKCGGTDRNEAESESQKDTQKLLEKFHVTMHHLPYVVSLKVKCP